MGRATLGFTFISLFPSVAFRPGNTPLNETQRGAFFLPLDCFQALGPHREAPRAFSEDWVAV